jgi:hypothetical protein
MDRRSITLAPKKKAPMIRQLTRNEATAMVVGTPVTSRKKSIVASGSQKRNVVAVAEVGILLVPIRLMCSPQKQKTSGKSAKQA